RPRQDHGCGADVSEREREPLCPERLSDEDPGRALMSERQLAVLAADGEPRAIVLERRGEEPLDLSRSLLGRAAVPEPVREAVARLSPVDGLDPETPL